VTESAASPLPRGVLFSRTVIGVVLATFFSDVGHEMVTAIIPLYLSSLGLGAGALGAMEGIADLLFSLAKLGGGVVGHHVEKKRLWGTAGYLATTVATTLMGFAESALGLMSLRGIAWIGRGFRGPMRDFILSDAVPATHFGRVYGIERSADMLGAVVGPLTAAVLLWLHVDLRTVIFVSLAPSLVSALSFFFLTKDKELPPGEAAPPRRSTREGLAAIPRAYWVLLFGVFIFGLGDFSRTFLILLAAGGSKGVSVHGALGTAVLLYALHNGISAIVAYPLGHLGDRFSKLRVLVCGYGVGVATNLVLTVGSSSLTLVTVAILLSAITLAAEETLEKAACADMLPRELRSLGLGILAGTNAVGDMASSIFVGWQLDAGNRTLAFAVPAGFGIVGTAFVFVFAVRAKPPAGV
jgi:MFS family permease